MPYKIHRTRRYGEPLAKTFAGGVFALVVAVAAWLWLTDKPVRVHAPRPAMMLMTAPTILAPLAEETKPFRLVYRNSVIPGGVHGASELAAALQRDPVAAAHYANFNVAAAHVVRVEKSRLVHVSYRIGDQIYWTKNKVLLTLGEDLLSDGTHLARARCGNRIADEPEGPILNNEPEPEVLDTAFVSAGDLIDQAPGIATGTTGSAPAAAISSAAQAFDPRIASTMQSLGMTPSDFLGSASMRSPVQQALAQTADAMSLAPASLTQRFDPVVPDDPVIPGTSPVPPAIPPVPPVPPTIPAIPPVLPVPPTIPPVPPTIPTIPPFTPPIPTRPTSIPEPGSAALFGLALSTLALVRFRANKIRPS